MDTASILFALLVGHWLADYPLQDDFLSRAKSKGPLRAYHLVAHAGIHAGAVAIITGAASLAAAEFVAHTAIDEAKTRGWISFAEDQALHIACKALWVALLMTVPAI